MKLYDVIRKEKVEKEGQTEPAVVAEEFEQSVHPHRVSIYSDPRFNLRRLFVFVCSFLFIFLIYFLGTKLVRATVVVTEKRIPFSLNNVEFELVPESQENEGRLVFSTMVVDKEVSRQVYGSEVEPSTSVASGKVVFFNEYSTASQLIKKGTILIGDNKKKYKTAEDATLSGYTLKDKKKEPGTSIPITINAITSGPSYNASGANFRVSNFSGNHAKQVYARSAGAITGGEDVIIHKVSDSDRASIVATLQADLVEGLKRESRAQIPDKDLTYPDLQVVTIDNNSLQLEGADIKFSASMKGSMITYLLNREMLENMIANYVKSDTQYLHVSIPSIADLKIVPNQPLPVDPQKIPDTLKIIISGEGTIIAKAPIDSLRQNIAGQPKKDFGNIISQIPEIDTAEYKFFPFWGPLFPTKISRINIKTQ